MSDVINLDPEEYNGLVRRCIECHLLYFFRDAAGRERSRCCYCGPQEKDVKEKQFIHWESMGV